MIDGDMERHEITHILTFGIIYLSNFAIWMIIKWYFNVVLISIYLIAGEFAHLFVYLLPTRTSPSVNCLGIALAHFSFGFSLSFCVGLKDLYVYSRNYSPDCFRHWQYLPPVCYLLNSYLRFLVHARGRNTLTEPQK